VRSLVRKFDLRPFKLPGKDVFTEQCDEIFDTIWFMNHTKLFPALQFAIMDEAVDEEFSHKRAFSPAKITPLLLSANGCLKTGRADLLTDINTENLMYLDLSYTKREWLILPQLAFGLPNLRVLKLRALGMRDSDFRKMTQIGGKLWSLDLRDNLLTDDIVDELISSRFMLESLPCRKTLIDLPDQDLFEDVPEYQLDFHGERIDTTTPVRPDESDHFMKYIEAHSSFPPISDQVLDGNDPLLRQTGLTHLYISKNRLTSLGVKVILSYSNRLQVLDIGSVAAMYEDGSLPSCPPLTTVYAQLNSKSVFSVSRESRSRMEDLRIHHSFVTLVPTITICGSQDICFALHLVEFAERSGMEMHLKNFKGGSEKAFSPLDNYRVANLILTGLPTKSFGYTIERLIKFLEDCRVQEERLEEARKSIGTSRRAPQLLPGLRTLRLEFLPEDTSQLSLGGGSVSGDRDADAFLASSADDFTFFDDPSTMSSVSRRASVASTGTDTTAGPASPTSRKSGGGIVKRGMSAVSRPGVLQGQEPPAYEQKVKDVIEELKKYRALKGGARWTGNLQLVFPYGR
jgi:hypothetical protein